MSHIWWDRGEELQQLACEAPLAKRTEVEESNDEDEDDDGEEPCRCSTIRDFDQAMSVSNDVVYFLYEYGMEEIVHNMFQVTCALEAAKLKTKLIQTDLTQYFSTTD